MNKFKNFIVNKGVYVIAMGCVAVICLSGLYIVNRVDKNKANPDSTNSAASSQTDDSKGVIALPTKKTEKTIAPSQTAPITSTPAATSAANASGTTPGATSTPGKTQTLKLDLPVKGTILVDYAMDKLVHNKTLDEWRTHSGVDIAAALGTEIKAAGDGKIIDVKKDPRLGYLIIIEHTDSIKTVYANLKEETDVKIGDSVKKGDVIGWVGRTAPFEFADEPHLHFEVLLNDTCVSVWNYATKE